jgi:hypothetical protein
MYFPDLSSFVTLAPMSKQSPCISTKKIYFTEVLAEEALIEARIQFDYPANRGPIAIYKCEDCGYFHLTSQGTINERLKTYLASGKIDKQKEANRWLDKLKHR